MVSFLPTEMSTNKQKLSETTLSEPWNIKIYSNQDNADSRKTQLKNGKKV